MTNQQSSGTSGLAIGALYLLSWELIRHYRKATHYESAYWAERRGRDRVQLEMKKLAEVHLNTEEGFFIQPIGHIESCYRQCVGTPRQGMLVPSSRAALVISSHVDPETLNGLEEFSHVWLTFKFHLNTNTLKEARAFSGTTQDSRRYTFTAKITPPMLKEKKGVLATRSPHRPNPVGVTLARVEFVDKKNRKVMLSACDLVDGTPVLDIKPYVHAYDSVTPFRIPAWIEETIETRNIVSVSKEALAKIEGLRGELKQFQNEPGEFTKALVETLEADVRSKFQTKRRMDDARKGIHVEVPFDETIVSFLWKDERVLEVVGVVLNVSCSKCVLGVGGEEFIET